MLEQELFDLLEGASDAAFVRSDDHEICSWNKAAENCSGILRPKHSIKRSRISCMDEAL